MCNLIGQFQGTKSLSCPYLPWLLSSKLVRRRDRWDLKRFNDPQALGRPLTPLETPPSISTSLHLWHHNAGPFGALNRLNPAVSASNNYCRKAVFPGFWGQSWDCTYSSHILFFFRLVNGGNFPPWKLWYPLDNGCTPPLSPENISVLLQFSPF